MHQVGLHHFVVRARSARLIDHVARQVDAVEPVDEVTHQRSAKARAAAQVERRREVASAAPPAVHQDLGRLVVQDLDQVLVELSA